MKNVVISHSFRSSEPPAWLRDVYDRRRRRTVRLIQLSIAALQNDGKRISLAALARVSRTIDPAEPTGVSESAILHNEEAYALYRQHVDRKRRPARPRSPIGRSDTGEDNRLRVKTDRDGGRARQRYLRANKADLVDRLLAAEQAYANMEARWLKTADDLLVWLIVLDRLLADTGHS